MESFPEDTNEVFAILNNDPTLINKVNSDDRTILQSIITRNDPRALSMLIHSYGKQINFKHRDAAGWTFLHQIASIGNLDCLEITKPHISNVNETSVAKVTPIAYAASKGHLEMVKALHALGGRPSIANKYGMNALHKAATAGHSDIVDYLCGIGEGKALVDVCDVDGNSPLHLAAESQHLECVRVLRDKHGANPAILNKEGHSYTFYVNKCQPKF